MKKTHDWLHPSSGISIPTPFNVEVGQSVYIQDLTWNILVVFGFSPST